MERLIWKCDSAFFAFGSVSRPNYFILFMRNDLCIHVSRSKVKAHHFYSKHPQTQTSKWKWCLIWKCYDSFFNTVPTELVLCWQDVYAWVRSSVRLSRTVRLHTANKRLHLEAPSFAYICILTGYVRSHILVQIVNVLDLHFKGNKF